MGKGFGETTQELIWRPLKKLRADDRRSFVAGTIFGVTLLGLVEVVGYLGYHKLVKPITEQWKKEEQASIEKIVETSTNRLRDNLIDSGISIASDSVYTLDSATADSLKKGYNNLRELALVLGNSKLVKTIPNETYKYGDDMIAFISEFQEGIYNDILVSKNYVKGREIYITADNTGKLDGETFKAMKKSLPKLIDLSDSEEEKEKLAEVYKNISYISVIPRVKPWENGF